MDISAAVPIEEHGTGATSPNWRHDNVSFVGNTLIVDLILRPILKTILLTYNQ